MPIIVAMFFMDDVAMAIEVVPYIISAILFFVGYFMAATIGINRFLCGLVLSAISFTIAFISAFTGG